MIKLIDILNEAKIVPQRTTTSFANTKHPAIYNFVVANKEKILQAIKDDYKRYNYTNYTFEGTSGITDISDTTVDNDNHWKYLDEEDEFPNGQEIEIIGRGQEGNCKGIIISNMTQEQHNLLTSGTDYNKIPGPYGDVGLYYDYIFC
jgi:hypothetical protein